MNGWGSEHPGISGGFDGRERNTEQLVTAEPWWAPVCLGSAPSLRASSVISECHGAIGALGHSILQVFTEQVLLWPLCGQGAGGCPLRARLWGTGAQGDASEAPTSVQWSRL